MIAVAGFLGKTGAVADVVRWGIVLSAGALLGLATGCGSDRPRCWPVTGTVRVDGKPADRAQLVFHQQTSADGKRYGGAASADEKGAFAVTTFTTGDGVPAGDYVVTVVWPAFSKSRDGEDIPGADRLAGRYANPQTSPLKLTVHSETTTLPPFELKSH